jgi:hypothetical protein
MLVHKEDPMVVCELILALLQPKLNVMLPTTSYPLHYVRALRSTLGTLRSERFRAPSHRLTVATARILSGGAPAMGYQM